MILCYDKPIHMVVGKTDKNHTIVGDGGSVNFSRL